MKKIIIIVFCISVSISFSQKKNILIFENNMLKGYINSDLDTIFKGKLQEIERFYDGYGVFKKDNKYGVVDSKGNIVIPNTYEYLTNSGKGFFSNSINDEYGLINYKNQIVLNPEYDYFLFPENDKNIVVKNKRDMYALFNRKGKQLTKFKYTSINDYTSGKIYFFKSKSGQGYLNSRGREILQLDKEYDYCQNFDNMKYAIVRYKGKYGLIDKRGKEVLKPLYENMKYNTGLPYDSADIPNKSKSNVYHIQKDGKVGLLNDKLEMIVKPIYDEISSFYNGFAYIVKNSKYGFINTKGEVVISLEYDDAGVFSEGLAPVVSRGMWGFINIKNEVIIDFKFTGNMSPFVEGVAVYRKRNFRTSKGHYVGDKCGYINRKGEVIIPLIYRDARNFEGGVGMVNDGKYEYIVNVNNEKRIIGKAEEEEVEEIESE